MSQQQHPLDDYQDWLVQRRGIARSTAGQYASAARSYLRFLDSDAPSLESYRDWLVHLQDVGKAPSTVNEYHTKVNAYLEYSGAEFNPKAATGELPDYDPNALPDPLDREEIAAMRDAADDPEERYIVTLLYHTGLRNSEFRELTWDDVDRESGNLHVVRRKKKGWADDTLPLYEDQIEVIDELEEWRDDDNPYLLPARSNPSGIGATVAQIQPDGPASGTTLNRRLRAVADRAGVERHIWAHLFRHTRATHMLEDTGDLEYVNQWFSHDKWETTLRYARLTGESLRRGGEGDSSQTFQETP